MHAWIPRPVMVTILAASMLCPSLGQARVDRAAMERARTKRQKALDGLTAARDVVREWTYCGKIFEGTLREDQGFRVSIQTDSDYVRQASYLRSLLSPEDRRFLEKSYPGFRNPPVLSLRAWTVSDSKLYARLSSPLSGGQGLAQTGEFVLKSGVVITIDKTLLSSLDVAFCANWQDRNQDTFAPREWTIVGQQVWAALHMRGEHELFLKRADGTDIVLDTRLLSPSDRELLLNPPPDVAVPQVIALLRAPGDPHFYVYNEYYFLEKAVTINAYLAKPVEPISSSGSETGYSPGHTSGSRGGGWIQAVLDEHPGCVMFKVKTQTPLKVPQWEIHHEDAGLNGDMHVLVPRAKVSAFEGKLATAKRDASHLLYRTTPISVKLCAHDSRTEMAEYRSQRLMYYGILR